jgi:hypothetical protein
MTKQFIILSALLTALLLPVLAQAEIYKTIDANGNVTYSNVKLKGAPASFPKVDAGTQNQRDGKRKEILQGELDAEKKALEDAKKAQAEGASNPEVFKTKEGKTFRNVAKFDEKMKALQADVDAHQRNIDLLTKEINATN